MRAFQVMRYGRRTSHELAQSINQTVTSRRRSSTSMFVGEHYSLTQYLSDEDDESIRLRRNTFANQKINPVDGIDSARLATLNSGRRFSFQSQEITEAAKSKSNLKNFYIFFVLLFLFIFIAVVYSFIRMMKTR